MLTLTMHDRADGIALARELGADTVLLVEPVDPADGTLRIHAHSLGRLNRLTRAFTGFDGWDQMLAHLTPDWAPAIALPPDASHAEQAAAAEFARCFNLMAEGMEIEARADVPEVQP